ncbi:unnamed protein product, partial [Callosobruchus maculatus]
ISSE